MSQRSVSVCGEKFDEIASSSKRDENDSDLNIYFPFENGFSKQDPDSQLPVAFCFPFREKWSPVFFGARAHHWPAKNYAQVWKCHKRKIFKQFCYLRVKNVNMIMKTSTSTLLNIRIRTRKPRWDLPQICTRIHI